MMQQQVALSKKEAKMRVMNATRILQIFFILITLTSPILAQNQVTELSKDEKRAVAAAENGVKLVKAGRHKEAAGEFELAIRLNPEFAVAFNDLGVTYNSLRRYEDAIKVLTAALRLSPDYADAYYNLGVAFDKLRQFRQAIK